MGMQLFGLDLFSAAYFEADPF